MDSASTHNLLHPSSLTLPSVTSAPHDALSVRYADGLTTCESIGSAIITTNNVSVPASIMPSSCLQNQLLGMAPFTNSGATATYDNTTGTIHHIDHGILVSGDKLPDQALWSTDIATLRPHGPPVMPDEITVGAAHRVQRFRSLQEKSNFLQLLMGNAPTSTMIKALQRGYLRTEEGWPVVTPSEYSAHAIDIHAVHQGHLRELRGGIGSTKPRPASATPAIDQDEQIPLAQPLIYVRPLGWHTDAKGPYSIRGYDGSTHEMIMEYGGFVMAARMKGTSGAAQLAALTEIKSYCDANCAAPPPTFNRGDQAENNPQVREFFRTHGMKLEFVNVHLHRANKAERAIQNWQAHRTSTLARRGQGVISKSNLLVYT